MSKFIPIELQTIAEKTEKNFIRINTKKSIKKDNKLVSKFGGVSFISDNLKKSKLDLLVSKDISDYCLLAQINLTDISKVLKNNENLLNDILLPKEGILQFFILKDDDEYGAVFEGDKKKGFFVNYESDVSTLINRLNGAKKGDLFPIKEEYLIDLSIESNNASLTSHEWVNVSKNNPFELLSEIAIDEKEAEMFFDNAEELNNTTGHQILGNPFLIYDDPRPNHEYILLLQIDSESCEDIEIMWGDYGVAQFFIKKDDLIKRNFNNIIFIWDC